MKKLKDLLDVESVYLLKSELRERLLDLEEVVAVLRANAVGIRYAGLYVYGERHSPPEPRLAILPDDLERLEKLL